MSLLEPHRCQVTSISWVRPAFDCGNFLIFMGKFGMPHCCQIFFISWSLGACGTGVGFQNLRAMECIVNIFPVVILVKSPNKPSDCSFPSDEATKLKGNILSVIMYPNGHRRSHRYPTHTGDWLG